MQRTSLQLTFHKRATYLVANLQKVSDELGSRHGTEEDRKRERTCVYERERMKRTSLQLTFHKRATYLVANLQKVSDEVSSRPHRQGTRTIQREKVCESLVPFLSKYMALLWKVSYRLIRSFLSHTSLSHISPTHLSHTSLSHISLTHLSHTSLSHIHTRD